MDYLFSREICCKVQWKARAKDNRPAIGHLTNIVAIFGGITHYFSSSQFFVYFLFYYAVVMTAVLETHKKTILIPKVLDCVQAARRMHQFNYQKSVNVGDLAGDGDEEDATVGRLEKSQIILLVKQRTKTILEALENYREL
jgi:hypothetical protein